MKVLRNDTGSPITLNEIAVEIAAGENYTIEPNEYLRWSKPLVITELTSFINSGDIVVGDGIEDLIPSDGINYLRYSDHSRSVLLDDDAVNTTALGATLEEFIQRTWSPDTSEKPVFLVNGDVDTIEFFKGPTQTTPNRRAKVTMAYDINLDPTTETWEIYDPNDGITVVKTVVFTHTFVASEITKTEMATS